MALTFARRRPGVVLAVLVFTGGGGAVAWNALAGQANRHPAPLFGAKPAVALVAPPRRLEAAAPIPAPRSELTVTTTQSLADPVRPEPARTAAADPIGTLIRTGSAPAKPSAAEVRPDGTRVLAAQKALTKLGYGPLKADGVMGSTTKGAVEAFERAKSLPVTGGLGPRTVRQLASASGIAVE